MKNDLKQLLIATQLSFLVLWPMSAWAATLAFGEHLASESLLSILATLLLSSVVGITALLSALKKEYEKSGEIKRLWLFIASNVTGSNTAGLFVYFGADSWGIPNGGKAVAIMAAAYGGNWFIERAVQSFTNKTVPEAK